MNIKNFVFNPFSVNTYIIYEEQGDCAIIDPGCYDKAESAEINHFIKSNNLNPTLILLTHAHLDHILGLQYIYNLYNIRPYLHPSDEFLVKNFTNICTMYGIKAEPIDFDYRPVLHNEKLNLGGKTIDCMHVPGHSPGSICYHFPSEKVLFSGDVLFYGSIGRTDLPGGDYNQLIENIESKLLSLPDDTKVFSGHYEMTTIGFEKRNNHFLK